MYRYGGRGAGSGGMGSRAWWDCGVGTSGADLIKHMENCSEGVGDVDIGRGV